MDVPTLVYIAQVKSIAGNWVEVGNMDEDLGVVSIALAEFLSINPGKQSRILQRMKNVPKATRRCKSC